MDKNAKIFVAGHRGMVGSAIYRALQAQGFTNLVVRTHKELDLTRQQETEQFFAQEKPAYVFLAAARVGGILANSTYKAEFIYQNITIAANVIHASYLHGVKKILNLGSTCIYPKFAPQPMKEEDLLSGKLEPTNEPYAIAKISAIKLCRYYNEQFGTNFMSVMPTNLYGTNDNYDLESSHLLPAFIRKFHLAKLLMNQDFAGIAKEVKQYGPIVKNEAFNPDPAALKASLQKLGLAEGRVTLWGSGSPFRELLYSDDLAEACLFLMQRYDAKDLGEFINIGTGVEYSIKEIAQLTQSVIGFKGDIAWDTSRPDGTPRKLSDVTRLNKLGWKAKTPLAEGIALAYQSYLTQLS